MVNPINLQVNETLYLTLVEKKSLERIKDWKNDKKLASLILSDYKQTSDEDVKSWFGKNMADQNQILLGIYLTRNELIGIVRVMFIDWEIKEAELGIYIGNEFNRGKGYGTEALGAIINYMFTEHMFSKLFLKVSSTNKYAVKSYAKLGFIKEKELDNNIVVMALYNKEQKQ